MLWKKSQLPPLALFYATVIAEDQFGSKTLE